MSGPVALTFDDGHAFEYSFDGPSGLLPMVEAVSLFFFFFFGTFLQFPTCPLVEASEYG